MRTVKLYVGEEVTLTCAVTRDDTGADWNPSSATRVVYDPEETTEGVVDTGTASTIVDAARTEADDLWNGIPLAIEDITDGAVYQTEVEDFVASTDTMTFGNLPVKEGVALTAAVGDKYTLGGYPVLTKAAATVSGNDMSFQATPANGVTERPRTLICVWHADMGTDSFREVWKLIVLPR